jgi:hypothetical protein
VLVASQRLCEAICPVVAAVYFDNFDETLFNLVFEMLPFDGYVFGPWFSSIIVG